MPKPLAEHLTRSGMPRRCHKCSALLPKKRDVAYRGSRPFCRSCVDLCLTSGCKGNRGGTYAWLGLCSQCGIRQQRRRMGEKLCPCGAHLERGDKRRKCSKCIREHTLSHDRERASQKTRNSLKVKPCKVCGIVGSLTLKKRYCVECRRARALERGRKTAKEQKQKRRAAKAGVRFEFSERAWKELLVAFGNRCAYCNRVDNALTKDHVTPISRGGEHTAENIVPACRRCNGRKSDTMPLEFLWKVAGQGAGVN